MAFGTSLFPGIGVIIFKSQINNKEKIIENKAEKEIGIEIDASGGGVMKKAFLLLLISIFPLISGCVGKHEDVDIYASIYPVEFLVREIVGDIYKVKPVYPRGKNVHDYEVSPSEVISLSKSKIVFYIGLGLEPVIEQSKNTVLADVPTISLTDNLQLIEINSEDYHGHSHSHPHEGSVFYDPHVWLDPINMQIMAETILENIISHLDIDSAGATLLTENCNQLKNKLKTLDNEFKDILSDDAIAHKSIIVDHDAYAYWQPRYGIARIKLRNDNESADISPGEMNEKINLAKSLGIKHICLTKNELESPIVQAYLKALGLTDKAKKYLHHLGTITKDEDKKGENYFSLMRYNFQIIRDVLPR